MCDQSPKGASKQKKADLQHDGEPASRARHARPPYACCALCVWCAQAFLKEPHAHAELPLWGRRPWLIARTVAVFFLYALSLYFAAQFFRQYLDNLENP